jgi:hypothetical protein
MRWWLHRLRHLMHWQRGHVVTAYNDKGELWIGFRCVVCGEVTGAHKSLLG